MWEKRDAYSIDNNNRKKTELSQASCKCYIICQSQTNETNFTQWLNSPLPVSQRSLLTAPLAKCVYVCAHRVCVCDGTFCSAVVLGPAGGLRLGVCSDTSQPNTENVLPALTNIFSNTLHSFLTCTTTSAPTTLLLAASYPCCSASCSQRLLCSFMFLLMH